MNCTTLPSGIGIKIREGFNQAHTGIADEKSYPLQTPFFQMAQEIGPSGLVFLDAFDDSQNLAVAMLIDSDRHKDGHVGHLTGPAALEYDPVEIHIPKALLDPLVSPSFNGLVNLLVEITDGSRTDLRAPERFGDILHPTNADTCQVHLDQGLFHRTFPATISFDDGGLEGLSPELGDVERNLTRSGVDLSLVMACPGVFSGLSALVSLGVTQPVGFCFQHLVKGFFYGTPDHARGDQPGGDRCPGGHFVDAVPGWR